MLRNAVFHNLSGQRPWHQMNRSLIIVVLLVTGSAIHTLDGQDIDSLLRNKRVYHSEPLGNRTPPQIDGVLDDSVWSLGRWQGKFTQQFPHAGMPATEQSKFKILYDRSNLYVAINCLDSEPGKIRNILSRRDSRGGDMAGIALDSYFDKRTAFEFSLTAAGQKMDLKHLGDYHFDMNWDAVWAGASSVSDSGWTAEMQIPLSQIRYAGREEHVWGLHIYRLISRKRESDSWQHIPREAPAMVYLFGELHGIRDIRTSRQVELLPYLLGSYTSRSDREPPGEPAGNAGLNAKVGISSDFTLDLSVNPDFGQVEADPSVLNLTAYEIFFQEKRPFFMEGNEIFDFEMNGDIPYYSRRIGSTPAIPSKTGDVMITDVPGQTPILGAVKLTGKTPAGWSVGVVNGLTARAQATATGTGSPGDGTEEDQKVEAAPLSNYLSSRIKREFREGNSSVGGVFSLVERISMDSLTRLLLPSRSVSGGLDLLHHWDNRNYFLEAKTIASRMQGSPEAILQKQLAHIHRFQRPDATHLGVDSLREHLSGHGSLIRAGKKGGKWNFSLQGEYRSPGLNLNDMGFIRQSDFLAERAEVSFDQNTPGKWYRDYRAGLYQEARWSFGGEHTSHVMGWEAALTFPNLWSAAMIAENALSALDTRELRGGPALRYDGAVSGGLAVSSNTARDLYGSVEMFYSHLGQKGSDEQMAGLELTWLPVRRVRLSGRADLEHRNYHQQYVTTIPAAVSPENGSVEYVVGRIDRRTFSFTFRGELFVTPVLSVQYYGNPYYSVGKYDRFRSVGQPGSRQVGERIPLLEVTLDPVEECYQFESEGTLLSFGNPDFSFMQFRSNLVFRWEYQPGSTLYVVWSYDRTGMDRVHRNLFDVMEEPPFIYGSHAVMIKLNYWFPF